ncbi:RNA polymerase sigma factor [Chitinophaga defluvii]|uniref:RNA polymerase sigma-70 factor n=1 Tax=Chitinophaga defluvii TaxID=3163343 RepID=A0ABV2TB15_9BACT
MSSHLHNEHELLQLAAGGSEAAFTTLFYLYKDRLYSYILRLTGSPEMAEDVVQDVFLKLWKHRSGLTEIAHLRGYVFRMAQHHAINAFKRMAREALLVANNTLHPEAVATEVEAVLELKEVQQVLSQAVSKLPPQQKLVYTLSREQGLKHEEIAQHLNISLSTVNKHMIQALRTIREQFRNHPDTLTGFYILLAVVSTFEK